MGESGSLDYGINK